jgi:hypothetical protein
MMILWENTVIEMFLIENLEKLESAEFFSRPYLNLGGCQTRDFDAQIADTTLAFITYYCKFWGTPKGV